MHDDFLSKLTGSVARARILRALIFNENEVFNGKRAGVRAGISPVAAQRELIALQKMGIVRKGRAVLSVKNGKLAEKSKAMKPETVWFLNPDFKHLRALNAFVREVSPMRYDQILGALKRSGKISAVILSGSFMGDPSRPADIVVAADMLNERRLETAVKELEPLFGRELRYAVFTTPEFRYRLTIQDRLIRDTLDFPHLVLLDKSRLL
ncbi:MAG: hypothetical protein RIQ56_721 [Candidatus Parcubacteria bacterium]|jgi:hypothetical protein